MPPTIYRDGGRLTRIATEASQAFLREKQDLSDKIASLATQHDLNPDEVERVVEQANHQVHAKLREAGPIVEFPLARIDKIASVREKSASALVHVERKPREKVAAETDIDVSDDPVAARQLNQIQQGRLERAKLAEEEARDAGEIADRGLEKAAFAFKQSLLDFAQEGGDLAEAMEAFAERPKLAAAPELLLVVAHGVKKVARDLGRPVSFTERTMQILTIDECRQKAAEAVESDLIASGLHMSGMPVAIINGEHQVWRDLDTLIDQYHNRAVVVHGIIDAQDCVHFERGHAKTRFDAAVHQAGRPV